MRPEDERAIAIFCHLSSLLWLPLAFLGLPIPFASVLIPFLGWITQREKSRFVDQHGRESLNFQLSMLLYGLILIAIALVGLLIFVILGIVSSGTNEAMASFIIVLGLGLSLYLFICVVWGVVQLGCVVLAAIAAYKGQSFRYPFTIRFVRD